jgi:hypothetical protein
LAARRPVLEAAAADVVANPRFPGDPELLRLGGGRLENALRAAAPVARSLAALFWLPLLAGLALLAHAARRAPTRRLGLRRAAFGLAVAGGATVAATSIARAIVLSTFDTSHGDAVVGTIWSAALVGAAGLPVFSAAAEVVRVTGGH